MPSTKHGGETIGTGKSARGFADMGPGIFLIAIMGCGDSDAQCQQVRLLDTQYQTRAECIAASEAALVQNGNVDYPTVVAQCVPGRQAATFKLRANDVSKPAPPILAPARIARRG
jgi:hypothetical protein